MTATIKKARVICFIDDDQNELNRFARAMQGRYDVVTGTRLADCRKKLQQRNLAMPDLWVLDLYFPEPEDRQNTPEELGTMNARYFQLHQATCRFREFLQSIGQGAEGGLGLIEKCQAVGGPVIMLTRKGTLEDAIRCLDKGAAAVLKKPMPKSWPEDDDPDAIRRAVDDAMMENSAPLIEQFERTLRANTAWARHKGAWLYCLGIATGAVLACCVQCLL